MNCPSNQELTDYIHSNKENTEIESHLLHCDKCMDTVILSQKAPKANNINYKAVFAFVAASLLLLFIPYNVNLTPNNELNIEVAYIEEYLEYESKEFDLMWELVASSVKEKEQIDYIEFFSDDDSDVFEI